ERSHHRTQRLVAGCRDPQMERSPKHRARVQLQQHAGGPLGRVRAVRQRRSPFPQLRDLLRPQMLHRGDDKVLARRKMMLGGATGHTGAPRDPRHRCSVPTELAETLDSRRNQPLPSDPTPLLLRSLRGHGALPGSTPKSSCRSSSRSASRYLLRSVTPWAVNTSSSMKKLPLVVVLGFVRIVCAASATISGVREWPASSEPTTFRMAAVSIVVRGHNEFAAIPSSASSAARPTVTRLIEYLAMLYARCPDRNHFGSV